MKKVTKSEFARMARVSAAAVGKAIKTNRLDVIGEGRKAKIDADCYKSIQYLKGMEKQRKGQGRPGKTKPAVKPEASKTRQKKDKPPAVKKTIVFPGAEKADKQRGKIIVLPLTGAGSPAGPKPAGEPPELSEKEKDYAKRIQDLESLAERYDIARTEKLEEQSISEKLKNARIRGELIDREKVYNNIFTYLDKLHSNLERLSDSFLSDIGPLMVDAGKVMPEHRTAWHDEVMSQIDESKKSMIKMLKKIQREQAKG